MKFAIVAAVATALASRPAYAQFCHTRASGTVSLALEGGYGGGQRFTEAAGRLVFDARALTLAGEYAARDFEVGDDAFHAITVAAAYELLRRTITICPTVRVTHQRLSDLAIWLVGAGVDVVTAIDIGAWQAFAGLSFTLRQTGGI